MKRNQMGLGLGGIFVSAILAATSVSANDFGLSDQDPVRFPEDLFRSCMVHVEKDCRIWAKRGGGGEMPRWMPAKTKVELAIGEKYILTGRVEFMNSGVYLRVDLKAQPWLANRVRIKNPFYRINDNPANWTKYSGRTVTIVGTSRYAVFYEGGRSRVEIYIEPASEPVIDALQP